MTVYTDNSIIEIIGAADAFGRTTLGVQLTNIVGLQDVAPAKQFQAGATAIGNLGLLDTNSVQSTYHRSLTEVMGLVDKLLHQLPATIVDEIGFVGVLSLARAVLVLEKLGLVDRLTSNDISQLKMIEALAFSDAALDFFGLGGTEAFGLSGVFTPSFMFNRVLTDTIGITSALSETALFMRIVTDNLGVEDSDIPSMIYEGSGVIDDFISFSIGMVDPDAGEFTSWAINTRTNAITEYQNYEFNSFCQIGNDYYGANSDGLWLLNSQTDDGANIPTDIKGAMLSLGGSRYTQLDGVYIGMRVDDDARDFILKLIVPNAGVSGADAVYVYRFTPKNMRTTKINIGKGLRARYIQWELVTPGPDFDLDSIEFVPVMSRRRTN